jgi:hypothetical protein
MAIPTGLVPISTPISLIQNSIYRLPSGTKEITFFSGLVEVNFANQPTATWLAISSGAITDALFVRATSLNTTIVCRQMPRSLNGDEPSAPFPIIWRQQAVAASLDLTQALLAHSGFSQYASQELLSIEYNYATAGGAGASADVRIVPANGAYTAGATVLEFPIDISNPVRNNVVSSQQFVAARSGRILPPASTLTLILSGTLTGLTGFGLTIWARGYPMGVKSF